MWEVLIAAAVVLALLGLSLVSALAPALGLLAGGAVLVLVGAMIGIPGGIAYHVALARVLGRRAALPPRWWLWPTSLHGALRPDERRVVMPWFYVGALGFALILVGAAAVLAAVLLGGRGAAP